MVSSRKKKNNIKPETTNSIDQKVLEIIQNEVAYETTLRKIEKNNSTVTAQKEKIISSKLKLDKIEVKEEHPDKLTIFIWVLAITALLLAVLYLKASEIITEFPFTEKLMLQYQQLVTNSINSVYSNDSIKKILSFW
ncbi:MAG: hypothetical protein OSB31_00755 [Paracoccaceae bacterium]|jgi:hypothetical protein|nr:hypothetical protein [Paracoccaceae bacterium]